MRKTVLMGSEDAMSKMEVHVRIWNGEVRGRERDRDDLRDGMNSLKGMINSGVSLGHDDGIRRRRGGKKSCEDGWKKTRG